MAKSPCGQQQPQSILAAPNRRVSLQCPTPQYFYNAHGNESPAVPKPAVFLQCSVAKSPCGAQPLQCRQLQRPTAMCTSTGGGGRAGRLKKVRPKNCTHTCNSFQGVTVTPHSVMLSPPILRKKKNYICCAITALGCGCLK